MQLPQKSTVLTVGAIIIFVLLAVWWYFGFTLDFMRFFAAEPGVTGPSTTTMPPQSDTVQCSPATQTVAVGAAAVVSASGGAGGYQWSAPGGVFAQPQDANAPTSQISVTYDATGTKKVTVQANRAAQPGDATTYIDSVACTVIVQ